MNRLFGNCGYGLLGAVHLLGFIVLFAIKIPVAKSCPWLR
jgi:hypothetical protein